MFLYLDVGLGDCDSSMLIETKDTFCLVEPLDPLILLADVLKSF